MSVTLATGAKDIWDLRLTGKKPNEPVFITCIGELNVNWLVEAPMTTRLENYDWRWVRNLCAVLVYGNRTHHRLVSLLSNTILRYAPNGGYMHPFNDNFGYLWLWNEDAQDGKLASWWGGHAGIPEIGIPDQPEEFEVRAMARYEKNYFTCLREVA